MEKSFSSALSLLLTLTPLIATHANTASDRTTNPPRLQNTYISGTRSETFQAPAAQTVTVIDRTDIQLSGARHFSELLRNQAGIQLQGKGGRNLAVSMAGFSSAPGSNVLVLIDGRTLNNPPHTTTLDDVLLEDVERIEILQGSAGVLYGDQAVAGVINVVTRRIGKDENQGYWDAYRSTLNGKGYRIGIAEEEDGLHYRLSTQRDETENHRENHRETYRNIVGRLGYRFSSGRFFGQYQRTYDDRRLPGPLSDAQAANDPGQAVTPEDYSNRRSRISSMGGDWQLSENWQLAINYADQEEGYTGRKQNKAFTREIQKKTYNPRLTGQFDAPGGQAILTLGADKHDTTYKSSANLGFEAEAKRHGHYSHFIVPLTRKLTATGGYRQAKAVTRPSGNNDEREQKVEAKEWGLSYRFSPSWRWFGRSADGFRFATIDEQASAGAGTVDPQQSQTQEVGVGWRNESHQLKASYYRMTLDNEIVRVPPASGALNLPESERQGAIANWRYHFNNRWSGHANYTYTDAVTADTNKLVPFIAQHVANIVLNYEPMKALALSINANYTGPRYRLGDRANERNKLDERLLWNANLILRDRGWELGIRVINLTDKTYSDYQAWSPLEGNHQYPNSGLTFEGRLTYRF